MNEPDRHSAAGLDSTTGTTRESGPLVRLFKNQAFAFLLVGAFNTALGTAWFIVWQVELGDRFGYHFAIVAGYVCNVLCAFGMYRYVVFRVRGHLLRDLWRFVTVNFGAFILNLALMTVAVSVLKFPPIPAQIAITAITATASFFGYRDFSFKRTKRATTS